MNELVYATTPFRNDEGYCDDQQEDWTDSCNIVAAFLDHRREWSRVMAELTCIRLPVCAYDAHLHRLAAWIDRRGRSLPELY